MSRAGSLARAFGSDGVLNVGDVAGLAAVASSGSASDLGTGTLPIARIADGAVTAAKLHTSAVTDKLGFSPVSGTARGVTVGGDANTYYPVAFTGFSERPCKISIWKHVHDYATWDGIVEFEAEFSPRGWGGYIGNVRIIRHRWSTKNFVADWASSYPVGSTFVVWLRGGGRTYSVATDYNETPTVYLTSTDLGSPPSYPWVVSGITSVQSKAAVDMNGVTAEYLNVDGGGRITKPYQPAFRAYYNGLTNIGAGTGLAPVPTVTTQNVGSHYNTSNGRFTAPVSGTYMFITSMPQYGSGPSQAYISSEVWINGTRTSVDGWEGCEGGYDRHSATHILYMNSGDYAQLGKEFHQASVVEGSSIHPVFSGYLLG